MLMSVDVGAADADLEQGDVDKLETMSTTTKLCSARRALWRPVFPIDVYSTITCQCAEASMCGRYALALVSAVSVVQHRVRPDMRIVATL